MTQFGRIDLLGLDLFAGRAAYDAGPGADPLTGLPDRRQLISALEQRLSQGILRPGVLVVQLDQFRGLIETLGHQIGDVALCRVAQRLRTAAGPNAVAARLGGDRFALLLEHGAEAVAMADRVIEMVERPYALSGHAVTLGVRVGVAMAPQDGVVPGALMQAAELALRQGPRTRQDLGAAEAAPRADRALRETMVQLVPHQPGALEQFTLYFQPQTCLKTGRLIGFEALSRWHHPERGLVVPRDYMPLAEEIGLASPLVAWALETGCRQAALWPGLLVAVKLQPSQLRRGAALVEMVTRALAESCLDPECLEIEISEAAISGHVGDTLLALRKLGVGLVLDGFGTGLSSLSQLGRHGFTRIRIDRSLVAVLGSDDDALAGRPAGWMVRAVASLGAGLGVPTIADGVETMDQMHEVRAAGCWQMQGPLVGRPIPACSVQSVIDRFEREGNTLLV